MTDDCETRCAVLEARAGKLNELWWAADLGSAEERRLELDLLEIEKELTGLLVLLEIKKELTGLYRRR